MQKNKKKNIFKRAALLLFFTLNIVNVTSRFNHKERLATLAQENVYGAFTLPDSSRWIYVHPTLGLDTNTGLAPSDPVQTLTKAQQVRSTLGGIGAIMLLDHVTLTAMLTINYDLVIASSPVKMDGTVNHDIFTLKRDVSLTNHLFLVSWNIELHLANIIIDGNRPQNETGDVFGAVIWVGTGHATYQANLYLHEGSVVTGGNRTLGGGAIVLERGLLYMNGGVVEYNYAKDMHPVIGGVTGSMNNKMYLISGEINNNISEVPPIRTNFINISELYISDDFILRDNTTSAWANMLPYSEYGTFIINNFSSRRKFGVDGVLNEVLEAITIVDENFIPLAEQPEILSFFEPANDATLYPHFDQTKNRYVWQTLKAYNANYDIITLPTVNTTGLLGRKAYIGDDLDGNPLYDDNDYTDEVVLPKLDTVNYTNITFDAVLDEVSYEYTYNAITYILHYNAPNDNYTWTVTSEPTEIASGIIRLVHPAFPGVTFDEIVLPVLMTTNYDVSLSATHIIFTYVDSLGAIHEFRVQKPFFGYTGTVDVMPTATTTGTALLSHSGYPGVTFGSFVLPRLNDYDYDLIISGEMLTYRYFHSLTGTVVNLEFMIPVTGYTVERIVSPPTADSIGVATLIHPDYPDYERTVTLPLLNSDDYTLEIIPSGNNTLGEVVYTYFVSAVDTAIAVRYAYDYALLDWDYHIAPTLTTPGSLRGTSTSLPGAIFTLDLPALSSEFYDIVEGEATITYTLKDNTYGTFTFELPLPSLETDEPDVPNEPEEEEEPNLIWLYVVGAVLFLALSVGGAVLVIRRRKKQ